MNIDFKTMLAGAKLPERSVPICLRGDLAADHEAAERELEQKQKARAASDSMAGSGIAGLVDRIEELEAEMQAHTYDFRLRALPKPVFRTLCNAHEPRRDDKGEAVEADKYVGVNTETFYTDLIRKCLIDPALDDAEWAQLEAALTDRQFDQLAVAAWGLNRHDVDVPFSHAASRMKRTTEGE